MRLYYNRNTRSTRPRWMLEELGVPYDVVEVNMGIGEHKTPEYLALHPHGSVPAFVDGDVVLFESAAICMYLADKFPEKGFAPPLGSGERGHYYKWVIYGMATAEIPVHQYFRHTVVLPDGQRSDAQVAEAKEKFALVGKTLSAALAPGPYLLGDAFTAADVVVGSIVAWANMMGMCSDFPVLQAYVARLRARPAFKAGRA